MSRTDASRTEADSRPLGSRLVRWCRQYQVGWLVLVAMIVAAIAQFRAVEGDRLAAAQGAGPGRSAPAAEAKLPRVGHPQHDVMALVNGADINRQHLIEACVRRHGEQVLESLVNKRLILSHCQKRGVTVSKEEIHAEIERIAKRFKLGHEQWFEMLEKERGIKPQEYARDIVWPTLALRKLAASEVEATEEEVQQAYDREFGEMINARLIAVSNLDQAKRLHAQLTADPNSFARAAIEHSIDVNSASVGGLIQPIRRHLGDDNIEQEAFRLQPGEISSIISIAGQYVILKCEGRLPARQVDRAAVREQLAEKIKDEKLREVAQSLFAKLQAPATIQNVYNNPQLRETMPGVVATVNGDRITMKELGQECLMRHGEEVLETEITRLLLKQSLRSAGVAVSNADMEAEVRHAAQLAGVTDEQGNADLVKWFETVTAEQDVDKKQYLRDSVWPSTALKKLTAPSVQVTEEDVQKGFEANYGQRVRCRAIVLGTMRRAQEVWDKARRNSSVEYFGDLAEEYSIEPTSKALRGEVPPLGRHSGQQQLEDAAFALQAGQLSGIIQVGDKFIILRCEGRTERTNISLDEVREILSRDIYEKKLRLAMSAKFESIRARARVDNYLAGTSHAPTSRAAHDGVRQDAAVRPTAGRR